MFFSGARVLACDLEPRHLEILAQRVPTADRARFRSQPGRLPDVNFPAGSFGGILCARTLHFLRARDIGLTVSGLLSRTIGGPSVFPLQPEGVWKNPYSNEKWNTSKGEDLYRRSLYTFIRRTSPHPAMMTFDASSRESCLVRRGRTNTPLQSLTLLNDEAALDNARALAKRMWQAGDGLKAQMIYGFRLCTSRQPKDAELNRLLALYEQQLNLYGNDERAALQLTKVPPSADAKLSLAEQAARVIVANVLLNLDETLTKE